MAAVAHDPSYRYPTSSHSLATLPHIAPLSPLSPFLDSFEVDHQDVLLSPFSDPSSARSSIITGTTSLSPEQSDSHITTAYIASRSAADLIRVLDLESPMTSATCSTSHSPTPQASHAPANSLEPRELAPPATIEPSPAKRNLLPPKKLNDTSSSTSSEPFSMATVPSIVVPPGLQPSDVRGLLDSIGPRRGHRKSSSDLSYTRRRPSAIPVDQSFLRMSQMAETLSEYDAPGRPRPSSFWASSTQASGDTFGTRRRRWSLTSVPEVHDTPCEGRVAQKTDETISLTETAASAQRRHSHRQESEATITAHLIQAGSKDDYRIVPSAAPPHSGTHLEELAEESEGQDQLRRSRSSNRGLSKVDQVLGVGAQAAATSSNAEWRIFQNALQQSVISSPGPLPPARPGHRATASVPAYPASSPASPVTGRRVDGHTRSESLDSVNTLTHLIDHSPATSPLGDTVNRPWQQTAPFRNGLSPDQRQILVRRMRTLEKRLGEPLREDEAGRWVVQPSQQGVTTTTHVSSDAWPAGGPRRDIPEWEREDCLPNVVPVRQGSIHKPLPGLQRNGSLAAKAKAALGIHKDSDDDEGIEVSVGREVSVAETGYKKLQPVSAEMLSPSLSTNSGTSVEEDPEDVLRRQRRLQIAKLSRLLGTIVSPAQLGNMSNKSLAYPAEDQSFIQFEDRRNSHRGAVDSGTNGAGLGLWASKIRQSIGRRSNSSKDLETMGDDSSFLDMRDGESEKDGRRGRNISGSRKSSFEKAEMSEQEKTLARKRAQKLGQVFGDVPPATMLQSTIPRPSVTSNEGPGETYDVVHTSLQGLIYLADHDPRQLAQIVDNLDESPRLVNPSLPSVPPKAPRKVSHPIDHTIFPESLDHDHHAPEHALRLDPQSRAARLKRTGKLTHFPGESVDLSQPTSPRTSRLDRLPARRKNRRETIDGVLGEMWKAVQADVGRGAMKLDESDRLGDLMSAFKKRRDKMGEGWDAL